MNYTKLPKKALLLLATPVMFSLAIPASKLVAQSQTETKIRLMAEGLRARNNGDFATAKANFEQLLVLAPNDVMVQSLLSGVNKSISSGGVPPVETAAPVEAEPVEVVYNPRDKVDSGDASAPAEVTLPPGASREGSSGKEAEVPLSPADALAKAEEARVKQLIDASAIQAKEASRLAKNGDLDGASAAYDSAIQSLPVNTLTEDALSKLDDAKQDLLLSKSQALLKQGDVEGAKAALDAYIAATSPEAKAARKQAARILAAELNPPLTPIDEVSPTFLPEQKEIGALVSKGRSQYVAGDIDGAQETFRSVETHSSENPEAKYFLKRIAEDKAKLGTLNREKTRALMLEEVSKSWQRPGLFVEPPPPGVDQDKLGAEALSRKLEEIKLPSVSFTRVELASVVSTLGALTAEYDSTSPEGSKGVNLVLNGGLPGAEVPLVNITLRTPMSVKRVLDIITQSVGYQYDVQSDLVLIKPSGMDINLVNEQIAVSKAAMVRMTGSGSASTPTPAAAADPFAPPAPEATTAASTGGEADSIRRFLQAAGVPFDTVPGASLAYDGASILVTHTGKNIERIRNILSRYNDVRQVEIEAKFIDVNEGALEELGVKWTATGRKSLQFDPLTGAPVLGTDGKQLYGNPKTTLGSLNRTLAEGFTSSSSVSGGGIVNSATGETIDISNSPPSPPGSVSLGGDGYLAAISGSIGNFDVTAQIRALSQKTGSDLLSAPKITVLSGNRATITIAQELRYPQSYGETQSDVGTTGGSDSGGSAGVTITAGTPEDFASRNIGVELAVTPTVEEDDYSISLDLNPRVTEFEGFVEYGGTSVAISGNTTVTIPSGFFQPVFSTREISTRVTVWDGATLVMGGLTREEVKRVNDKVPILGDIPFLGRAFRSKGEATQKRNLLIFVTANLVSPGGSLKKQELRGVPPSSTYQNPSLVTPSGSESRIRGN